MSVERFHLKALPVREFCAKFCDETVLFSSVTERAPGLPDHSSTSILPRGGSPLAVPRSVILSTVLLPAVRIQIAPRMFLHYMLPEHTWQFKLANVYHHSAEKNIIPKTDCL